jgi:phage shock protein A
VTEELDRQVRLALQRRRRSPVVPIAVVVFAVIASGAAYLWLSYGDQVRSGVFAAPPAGPVIASGEESVSRADFETFKRQAAESLQSTIEGLDAQKADLKKLADQVAALSAKVHALQSGTSAKPAQTSSVVPAATPVIPLRPATVAQRRKLPAPKPTGPISIGGAPLPPAPPSDR